MKLLMNIKYSLMIIILKNFIIELTHKCDASTSSKSYLDSIGYNRKTPQLRTLRGWSKKFKGLVLCIIMVWMNIFVRKQKGNSNQREKKVRRAQMEGR